MSAVAGGMWMGWFVVQLAVVGLVSWQQPLYFALGLLILTLAMPALARWLTTPLSDRSGDKK